MQENNEYAIVINISSLWKGVNGKWVWIPGQSSVSCFLFLIAVFKREDTIFKYFMYFWKNDDGFESDRPSLCVYKLSFSNEDAANQQPFLHKAQRQWWRHRLNLVIHDP